MIRDPVVSRSNCRKSETASALRLPTNGFKLWLQLHCNYCDCKEKREKNVVNTVAIAVADCNLKPRTGHNGGALFVGPPF